MPPRCLHSLLPGLVAGLLSSVVLAAERTERFDRDPQWAGQNHRAVEPAARSVRQDFGYSRSAHAGGQSGEVGGFVTAAAEPAYYGAPIARSDFDQPLTASGTLAVGDGGFHALVGFFNAETLREWRTPNSIALRLNGRGEHFYAYLEYCTARWRAGGDDPRGFATPGKSGRMELIEFPSRGKVHRWSLRYDPRGNNGAGTVTAAIDDHTATCNLAAGHKQDGAVFDHFGLMPVMKSADDGAELWIDDVTINGRTFDFQADPGWDALNNRRTYTSPLVRPRFDFGFSPTHWAGGTAAGELGGILFRGDCRYPQRMACYADRLEPLTLARPLRAAGKVVLRRAVSDSGVLIGFFDSQESMRSNPSQKAGLPAGFFGVSTDAPSREGFYFAPTYRLVNDAQSTDLDAPPPHLYPDGKPSDFSFEYSPTAADGRGQVKITLGDATTTLTLRPGDKSAPGHFDRFGIITPWIDGNSQTIYFDDLTYTFRQD